MADDKVHKPSLPGVKTLTRDIEGDDNLGITFIDPKGDTGEAGMHSPEETVSTGRKSGNASLSGNAPDVSGAFESGLEEGTIITDKKDLHGGVGNIAKSAFGEWISGVKSILKKIELFQKEIEPTMTPVEKRKEIISEAGKLTKQAPRDDHNIVVEKLKTLKQDTIEPTKKPIILKKKPPTPLQPQWTHTIDESLRKDRDEAILEHVHDFRKPSATSSSVVPQPPSSIPVQPVQRAPVTKHEMGGSGKIERADSVAPKVTATPGMVTMPRIPASDSGPLQKQPPQPEHTNRKSPIISTEGVFRGPHSSNVGEATKRHLEKAAAEPPKPVPEPRQALEREDDEAERFAVRRVSTESQVTATPVEETGSVLFDEHPIDTPVFTSEPIGRKKESQSEERAESGSLIARIREHRTETILIGIVVIVGGTLGVFGAYFLGTSTPPQVEVGESEPIPTLFETNTQIEVPFSHDHAALMRTLNETLLAAQGASTHIVPVLSAPGAELISLPANETLIGAIAPHIPSTFGRALKNTVMIGSITTTSREPFIILQSNNFDTAFAGMLSWEPFMAEDLAPFFETSTRTSPQTDEVAQSERGFSDATRENRSIRILYDHNNNERIIYGFVARDTIVITESTAALSALIRELQ